MKIDIKSTKQKILIILTLLCSGLTSQGMETFTSQISQISQNSGEDCVLPKRNLKEGEIPLNYKHCTIAQQIKYYREHVYDVALKEYNGNVKELDDKPIARLSLIIENVFALANDQINKEDGKTFEYKKMYSEELLILWNQAQVYNEKLTSNAFQKMNAQIAKLLDLYHSGNNDKNKILSLIKVSRLPHREEGAVFILYGNPNPAVAARHISPFHFVDQFFAEPYPAFIVFFDVLSVKKNRRTKKDPHWSAYNGIFKMLYHDFLHVAMQQEMLMGENVFLLNWLRNTEIIHKRLKKEGKINEATILIDGLFILTHEISEEIIYAYKQFSNESSLPVFHQQIKDYIIEVLSRDAKTDYGSPHYKQHYRDREFILRDKYWDNSAGRYKVVYDKEGKSFLDIEYDSDKKKTTRPFKEVENTSERNSLMQEALKSGYTRFWNYFFTLCE